MKTVKRVLAIVVAVLMVAMMIPAVSAAANTVNWTCDKEGYTFTVYKVASYNATTGAFTATVSSLTNDVKAAATETEMAALANKCKTTTFSDAETTFASTATTKSGSFEVADGIYYIKCTGQPANYKGMLKESIVVFPNAYDNGENATELDVALTDKIDEGQPKTYKDFLINGVENHNEQTFGSDDTITYILKADVPGSTTNKLTSFVVTDQMGNGLDVSKKDDGTFKNISITSVDLKKADGTVVKSGLSYTLSTDASVIGDDNTFGVVIASSELSANAFYGDTYQVVVVFTAKLLTNAPCATLIPNHDDSTYTNASGSAVVPGQTVELKTYGVQAIKVDANDTSKKLGGATFQLYKEDKETLVAEAVSADRTGIASFDVRVPEGTYYVKETAPPTGYNLNSSWSEAITVGPDTPDGIGSVTISDTKAKMPSTGGNGTMVFTIVGGSLVLLAAALFVVVMKKRSSAK